MILSVIIVSYNTKDLTLQTVDSVFDSVSKSKKIAGQTEVIVVDNDSNDNSVSELKTYKEKTKINLTIIQNKNNDGFGVANNIGLTKAQGKYILFLNSDTIVRNNALEKLVQRFETPQEDLSPEDNYSNLGIIAPVLLNTDLTYQPQGGALPTLFSLSTHMFFLDDLPLIGKYLLSTQQTGKANSLTLEYLDKETKLIPRDWVGGTALFTSQKVLKDIGAFDPNIFMYGEDVELCLRAKHHHYDIGIDPTARIIHLQNASSSSGNAIKGEFLGYKYIFAKHYSSSTAALAKIILQIGALLRIFLFGILLQQKQKAEIYKSVLKDLD